jgi:hypothetical protein
MSSQGSDMPARTLSYILSVFPKLGDGTGRIRIDYRDVRERGSSRVNRWPGSLLGILVREPSRAFHPALRSSRILLEGTMIAY